MRSAKMKNEMIGLCPGKFSLGMRRQLTEGNRCRSKLSQDMGSTEFFQRLH